jgi:hypothetical protein
MMAIASIVAIAYVVGQGVLLWVALRFVSNFGAFVASHERATQELLLTHESNLLVHRSNLAMLDKLAALYLNKKVVA